MDPRQIWYLCGGMWEIDLILFYNLWVPISEFKCLVFAIYNKSNYNIYIISKIPYVLKFGLLTNPSIDIVKEIIDIYDLGFDYVEIGLEVPEGNGQLLLSNKSQILDLLLCCMNLILVN